MSSIVSRSVPSRSNITLSFMEVAEGGVGFQPLSRRAVGVRRLAADLGRTRRRRRRRNVHASGTTAPAATIEPLPTRTPLSRTAPIAIKASSSTAQAWRNRAVADRDPGPMRQGCPRRHGRSSVLDVRVLADDDLRPGHVAADDAAVPDARAALDGDRPMRTAPGATRRLLDDGLLELRNDPESSMSVLLSRRPTILARLRLTRQQDGVKPAASRFFSVFFSCKWRRAAL